MGAAVAMPRTAQWKGKSETWLHAPFWQESGESRSGVSDKVTDLEMPCLIGRRQATLGSPQ
jgi:hypothetical protein